MPPDTEQLKIISASALPIIRLELMKTRMKKSGNTRQECIVVKYYSQLGTHAYTVYILIQVSVVDLGGG